MYTPKTFPDILDTMASQVRASNLALTDFNVGSVTRSWLEAGALALDELWMHTAQNINDGIIEAVYLAHGFDRLPAQHALGELTFYVDSLRTEDIVIPAGSKVRKAGSQIEYITTEEGVIAAGQYFVSVMARAVNIGPEANVDANELTVPVSSDLLGILGLRVINRTTISNGRLEETDLERKERFAHYIETLSRGTVSALDYAARLAYLESEDGGIEQVIHVSIREVPGTVWVYVHNGTRNTSQALVDHVASIIEGSADYMTGTIVPGWRSAGVEVIVLPMIDMSIHFEIDAQLQAGYSLADVKHSAERALEAFLRNFRGDFISIPQVLTTLYFVPGLLDVTINYPTSGILVGYSYRPVFAGLTINV